MYSLQEHRELGSVNWLRSFDDATNEARSRGVPILLLFQEIPGCSTCVNFGQDVLTHPLMVELIETHFVPLAIFNNRDGADAEVLRRFGEPAWNNPVVYFLGPDGDSLVPKLTNRYDIISLHDKITAALERHGTEVPPWFALFRGDLLIEAGVARRVRYETPCFWSGETSLAQIPSVISTDAGWIDGEEVVEVYFDPTRTTAAQLDRLAEEEGFRRTEKGPFRLDDQPQFYLAKSNLRTVSMTKAQRTEINVALPYDRDPLQYLSPRQREMLDE